VAHGLAWQLEHIRRMLRTDGTHAASPFEPTIAQCLRTDHTTGVVWPRCAVRGRCVLFSVAIRDTADQRAVAARVPDHHGLDLGGPIRRGAAGGHRPDSPRGRPARSERNGVGYLAFDFYNGAMSTRQCRLLRDALRRARAADTKVIVLLGGRHCL
jgi:hypothetical protein